jgi:hypothetical protein
VTHRTPTRRTLWRLLAGLLVAAGAVLVGSASAFQAVHATAAEVQARSAPSVLGVAATRAALVAADAAAIGSFHSGEARLAGPGDRYQSQIAVASQSLAQVAENNVAGPAASQTIQLLEGLLVAYTSLIEQADVQYRQEGDASLGAADLWYASHLLHMPDGGVLAELDTLRDAERTALAHQLATGGTNPLWTLAWAVPAAVLFALLAVTQVFLRRRFGRTLTPPLAAATLILLLLVLGMGSALRAGDHLKTARTALSTATADWQTQVSATDRLGQAALVEVVQQGCRDSGCGATFTRFVAALPSAGGPGPQVADRAVAADVRVVNREAAAATRTTTTQVLLLVAGLAIVVSIPLGLYRRIEEYRYRR